MRLQIRIIRHLELLDTVCTTAGGLVRVKKIAQWCITCRPGRLLSGCSEHWRFLSRASTSLAAGDVREAVTGGSQALGPWGG